MFAASGTSIIYHAWPWMENFMYDKHVINKLIFKIFQKVTQGD